MSKRRTYTPKFKAQVVLEEITGIKDRAEICRERRLTGDDQPLSPKTVRNVWVALIFLQACQPVS